MTERTTRQTVVVAIFALALVVALALRPGAAHAKAERQFSWPFEKVWPAALRLLRVDEKFKILERDQEAGFVLFQLVSDGKEFEGAMELVRVKDSRERDATRVLISIPGRPDYVGDAILERLKTKLFEELGDPPDPPAKQKDPPPVKDETPKDDAKPKK